MNFEHLITRWMEYLFVLKGRRPRGVGQYQVIIRRFMTWIYNHTTVNGLGDITREHVEDWMKALFYDMGNISNQSRASKLSALRSFFGWLREEGHIDENPTHGIPTPKISKKHPQVFTTEELKLLFAAPDRTKLQGLRDYTVIRTLHAAGPRVSELCSLDIDHIHDSGGYIRICFQEVKGGNDRTIILKQRAAKVLRDWITVRTGLRTDHQALFVTIRGGQYNRISAKSADDILKHYARLAGLGSVKSFCHKLRSTFATDLYDETGDPLTVQLAMGHKRMDTTLGYIAVSKRHLDRLALPNSRFKELEGE